MWQIGHIPENIITDEYRKLNYISEPFNNVETTKKWDKLYGKIYATGDMADYRQPQPDWTQQIIDYIGLSLSGSSYYRMSPGKILPYHRDTYQRFISYHCINNIKTIHRAIIFLEDWTPGHIFEVDGDPIYNYKAGTYVLWQYDTPHMAANLGLKDRYTLQITGCL